MAGDQTAGDAVSPRPEEFRALFGSYPTAVSVVTTIGANGEPVGLTCSAICSLSMRPPLLLVCVDEQSKTLHALLSHGAFAVNVLADGATAVSRTFSGKSADKFTSLSWTPSRLAKGAPLLTDAALGHAECVVTRTLAEGDHWILIGRIVAVTVYPRRPLLYYKGAYSAWNPAGLGLEQAYAAGA